MDREAVAIASRTLAAFFGGEIMTIPAELKLEKVRSNMNIAAPFEMPKIDELEKLKPDYKAPELEEEEDDDDDDIPF